MCKKVVSAVRLNEIVLLTESWSETTCLARFFWNDSKEKDQIVKKCK